MLNRDQIRFKHMLDAVEAAVSHPSNSCREDLDNNRLLPMQFFFEMPSDHYLILYLWTKQ